DSKRDRPGVKQSPSSGTSSLVLLVPVALLGGLFGINRWLAADKRPVDPHWFFGALVAACALSGGVLWLVGQDVVGILFLVLAGVLAFVFHVFSPLWYHLRTGVYLTNLERYTEAEGHLQRAWSW